MIKVLHLQTELNLACGVTRTIFQITKNTTDEFEHFIIANDGDGISRFNILINKPILIKKNRNTFLGSIEIIYFIIRFIKENKINIIHSHHRYFDTLSWIIKLFFPIQTVTSVQSKVFGKSFLSYKADILIPCSNSIKNHLIKNFNIPNDKIQVIYNSAEPVDTNTIRDKNELLKELNIPDASTIIGFIGRIDFTEKGIDILLEVFNELGQNFTNLFLILVGNGKNENEVRTFMKKNQLNARLIPAMLDITEYLNLIDIFILPSRVEPFGIVIIEAGLMKTPVIASNVGGIPEIIDDEKNGLLFESENIEELKKKIIRLYNDKELSKKLGENLQKKISEYFTTDKIIPQYEQVYRNVIK